MNSSLSSSQIKNALAKCTVNRQAKAVRASTVASSGKKERIIIGIESSCDDTGIAVVTSEGRVLGESIAHQHEVHANWGGVVPTLAMEAHRDAIDRVFDEALNQAGLSASDLDGVAVTIGPGLSMCLRVGVLKARQVAYDHSLPIIPVHHMEAHALVARMTAGGGLASSPVRFPFLCLLVSGGHNMLLLVRGVGDYEILGTTLDDALGEAYDKVARLLGLSLVPSGGAVLEALAREGDADRHKFTLPLLQRPTADFSFSGLKTAVRMAIEAEMPWLAAEGATATGTPMAERPPEDVERRLKADIAASFQKTAIDHLAAKLRRGIAWGLESEPACRHLVVAGGVAANQYIRGRLGGLTEEMGLELVCPPPRYCTDNGVMVAWAGVERSALGLILPPPATRVPLEGEWVDLKPRWPLGPRDARAIVNARSAKKRDVHVDLTTMTRAELEAVRARAPVSTTKA